MGNHSVSRVFRELWRRKDVTPLKDEAYYLKLASKLPAGNNLVALGAMEISTPTRYLGGEVASGHIFKQDGQVFPAIGIAVTGIIPIEKKIPSKQKKK